MPTCHVVIPPPPPPAPCGYESTYRATYTADCVAADRYTDQYHDRYSITAPAPATNTGTYHSAYSDIYSTDAAPTQEPALTNCCYCAAIDVVGSTNPTYVSPAADPAPWYQSSRVESGEFLGFYAAEPRTLPVVSHAVSPRGGRGSVLGSYTLRGRVLTVQGFLMASTPRGMSYGERWLTEALLGKHCLPREACNPADLRMLPACPGVATEAEAAPWFRYLIDVKLTDGPVFSSVVSAECYLQAVSFELTASQPYLFNKPRVVVDATI